MKKANLGSNVESRVSYVTSYSVRTFTLYHILTIRVSNTTYRGEVPKVAACLQSSPDLCVGDRKSVLVYYSQTLPGQRTMLSCPVKNMIGTARERLGEHFKCQRRQQ